MVHQRRFWGNTRGLGADLGRGPKQVEKTRSNRLKKYHAERRCQKSPKASCEWPRRKTHKPPEPPVFLTVNERQKNLTAKAHPGRMTRDLKSPLGGPIRPIRPISQALQHRARIGLFGDWLDTFRVPVLRFSTLGPACHPGAFPVQAPDKAPETSTWSPGSEGGRQLARPRPRRQPDRVQAGRG